MQKNHSKFKGIRKNVKLLKHVKLKSSIQFTLRKISKFHLNYLVGYFCGNTVSAESWAIRTKLCSNCAFAPNCHTKKLDEISVFTQYQLQNLSAVLPNSFG